METSHLSFLGLSMLVQTVKKGADGAGFSCWPILNLEESSPLHPCRARLWKRQISECASSLPQRGHDVVPLNTMGNSKHTVRRKISIQPRLSAVACWRGKREAVGGV